MDSPEMPSEPEQIDAAFDRAERIALSNEPWMDEVLSDYAHHLCILATGFLERAVVRVFQEYVDAHGDSRIGNYVDQTFQHAGSMRARNILRIAGEFDEDWKNRLDSEMTEEHRMAIGNLYSHRNNIAHGRDSDLTYRQVRDAYNSITETIGFLEEIVESTPSRYPRA